MVVPSIVLAVAAALGGALILLGLRSRAEVSENLLLETVQSGKNLGAVEARRQERAVAFLTRVGNILKRAGILRASEDLNRRLEWARWRISPEAFIAAEVLAAGTGLVVGLMMGAIAGAPAVTMLSGPLFALGGWLVPGWALDSAVGALRRKVAREALGFGDFLVAAVGAGMPLDQALERLGEEIPGVLPAMVARAVRESRLSRQPLEDALEILANELSDRNVTAIVQTIVQAKAIGAELSGPLDGLVASLRMERQQKLRTAARGRAATNFMPLLFVMLPGILIPIGFIVWSVMRASGF